jgi:hypothetical protein
MRFTVATSAVTRSAALVSVVPGLGSRLEEQF